MSKILITGAAGFIGSHLAEYMVRAGHSVRAFVRYNSGNRRGWLDEIDLPPEIEVALGDVRDLDAVSRAMRGCDAVFHLAALIGIPYSYVSPLAYVRTNIEGTYNVLQAARALAVSQLLITSTSETYGTAQYVPIDESHPVVGQSPYAATKIGADQLAISYHRAFALPVKIVRPFNVYGPRQSLRAIIPSLVTQLLAGNEEVRMGSGHPTRDFTFVEDTVRAFDAIFRSPGLVGEVTNIGMGTEITMHDLATLIGDLVGRRVNVAVEVDRIRPPDSEVERLCCDNTKLLTRTDWRPLFTLETGLAATIAAFRDRPLDAHGTEYTL